MEGNISTFGEPSRAVFDISVVVRVTSVHLGEGIVSENNVVPCCSLLVTSEVSVCLVQHLLSVCSRPTVGSSLGVVVVDVVKLGRKPHTNTATSDEVSDRNIAIAHLLNDPLHI